MSIFIEYNKVDHLPPAKAVVKIAWNYTSTTQYASMAWCL